VDEEAPQGTPAPRPGVTPERRPIPLVERKFDWVFLGFFLFNLLFITYFVDVEQVLIPDTSNFTYPLWPPKAAVDLFHWYGRTYDPLLVARPPFWRATIWLDVLLFGPYYIAAIYAFWKGKDWIRLPTIIYATMLFTNVVIILFEERLGIHKAGNFAMVFGSNLAWLVFPVLLVIRMWPSEHPFTRHVVR